MKHLVLNVYASGAITFDEIAETELRHYIDYNKLWRFGRLIYVDGKRVYNGCIAEGGFEKYDQIAKDFYASRKKVTE